MQQAPVTMVESACPGTAPKVDIEKLFADSRIEYVPLGQLVVSPHNVRKQPLNGIPELAENISVNGLISNLVGHRLAGKRGKNAKIGVCAGQRRLAALALLLEQGRLTVQTPIGMRIVSEGDAVMHSLSENEQREDMHPADLALSFEALINGGRDIGFVATVFGCSESAVRRHLKLANLSPALLDVFRAGEMTYEQATTLTLASAHDEQERVWNNAMADWQRQPNRLREAIVGGEIEIGRSPALKLVTLAAYEAAGGAVRRDLFSGDDAGYITDAGLLNSLLAEKLNAIADEIRVEEGWAWVETRERKDHAELMECQKVSAQMRELTEAEQTEHAALKATRDAAELAMDAYYESDDESDSDDRYETLRDTLQAAEQALDQFEVARTGWTAEQRATLGAFVMLNGVGEVEIERGRLKQGVKRLTGTAAVNGSSATDSAVKAKPVHSESLTRRLTAHRTAAVQAELAAQPGVAMAVLLHRMLPTVFPEQWGCSAFIASACQIQTTSTHSRLLKLAEDLEASAVWQAIDAERRKWAAMLPDDVDELFPWLLGASDDITSSLFAYCVAATVDGVTDRATPHAVNAIAETLEVDQAKYWTPTGVSYLGHVSKARICEVVAEAISPKDAAPLAGMKKADAAKAAEALLSGRGWLPDVLSNRDVPETPSYGRFAQRNDNKDDDNTDLHDDDQAEVDTEPPGASEDAPDADAAQAVEPADQDSNTVQAIDWMHSKELHTAEQVQALGVAVIDEVGSENVYVQKDGAPYFFKPGNAAAYEAGQHDFSHDTALAA